MLALGDLARYFKLPTSLTTSFETGPNGKQLIIAGVVTEVCVAFPALSALQEGFDVFVVTGASGTFNEVTRHSAWDRMSQAGAQLMTWFGVACELYRFIFIHPPSMAARGTS